MLLIIYLILIIISFYINKDTFSPIKFYILYIGVYFLSIFYDVYNEKVYYIYLLLLLLGLILVIVEPKINKPARKMQLDIDYSKSIKWLWILSIIPILAQLKLITDMGGIQSYINLIGFRVVMWQGKGIILTLIKMFGIINLVYFALILDMKKSNTHIIMIYIMHLCMFITIGLLSGSRGSLLSNFLYMLILYHYMIKRINFKKVTVIVILLILVALGLGEARQSYRVTDEGLSFNIVSNQAFKDRHEFKYGVYPLEVVMTSNINELQYGKTFLTAITNFIPRVWWPNKPDPGGVVFTKLYLNNAWEGYSNHSTGIITESIINFGLLGILVGLVLLFSFMYLLMYYYRQLIISFSKITLLRITSYIILLTAIPGLVTAEWTNLIVGTVIKIVYLVVICSIIRITSQNTNPKRSIPVMLKNGL
ncbi:O-antigen polymerase [Syntrophomonas wolfei]|nr:O-antigen polymerase [Syntrophomonas wolfei]